MVMFSYREHLLKVHQLFFSLCNGTRDSSAFRVVFTSFHCFVVAVVVGTNSHFAYKQVSVYNHLHNCFVNAVY